MIRILAVQCRNVGSLQDCKISFGNSLNLILGENEAGKSSLVHAIAKTLFGATGDRLRPIDFQGDYGAAIRLESPKGQYILDRNFADNRVQIFAVHDQTLQKEFDAKVSPRGRSADFVAYQDRLKALIGIADRDLFEATVLLHEQDIGLGRAETVMKIKQLLAGQATHDYDAVMAGLWERYFEITIVNPNGRNKTNPRMLERVQAQRRSLVLRHEEASQRFDQCLQLRNRIEQGNEEIGRLQVQIEQTNELLKMATEYFKFESNRQELEEKHENFTNERRRSLDLAGKFDPLERELAGLGMAGSIDEATADRLRNRVTLERRIEQQRAVVDKAAQQRDLIAQSPRTGIMLTAAAALIIALGGIAVSVVRFVYGFPILLVATVLAGVVFHLRSLRKTLVAARTQSLDEAREEQARLETEAKDLSIPPNIAAIGPDQFPQLLAERERALSLLRQKENVLAQIQMLPSLHDVDEALTRIERELAVLLERRDRLARSNPELTALSHDDLIQKMTELSEMENRLEQFEARRVQEREKYAALAAVTENPDALIEQIEDLDERIALLSGRRDAVLEALQAVEEAIRAYRSDYLRDFSSEVDRIFSDLVDRSSRSVVLDNDLEPRLQTDRGTLPLERLSTGTHDQLYLACRIALADKLSEPFALPFLLDDPLVHFDSARKARAIELLRKIAVRHQILLFSCDEGLAELVGEKATVLRMK